MLKYASAEILGAEIAPSSGQGMARMAHRVSFDYEPRPGFLYVRSRMISSRCNDNYDEFPADEIKGDLKTTGYVTFEGKPVFVNHHNDDHRRSRGLIVATALHEDWLPSGARDTWAEGLQEIDALSYPKLAQAIMKGRINRTSMGVDVAFSVCAACGNRATTPMEYCAHIPGQKGRNFVRIEASTGQRKSTLIREKCHGLRFFENSLLVEPPADPTAYFLDKPVLGPGLEHLSSMSHTASRRSAPPREQATIRHGLDNQTIRVTASATPAPLRRIAHGGRCPLCYGDNTISMQGAAECFDCEHVYPLRMQAAPRHADPSEHPFFQANPVSAHHIVAKYNSANDDEKASGHNWYSDAGLVAKALGTLHKGQHPHGNTHLAAGLIANYSAQTPWADNQHHAARVLHTGVGIGGKGSGIFASASQREKANRMLGGASNEEELTSPKISDFGHLVEHGGDKDPENPHVVVDRHALSVAMGKRASEQDYSDFPKSTRHYYGHVVNQYHEAARQLSEQTGSPVAAHQVQATTWLAHQRHISEADKKHEESGADSRLNRGRSTKRQRGEQDWSDFKQKHLPDLSANPGTGYTAARSRRGRR